MPRTPPRIAIVDDDESVRRALVRLLRLMGWRIEAYRTAEAFLKSIEHALPDCAILDVHLPGMNGLELHQRLKAEDVRVPVVFITADPNAVLGELGSSQDVLAVLRKPFDCAVLVHAVGQALE